MKKFNEIDFKEVRTAPSEIFAPYCKLAKILVAEHLLEKDFSESGSDRKIDIHDIIRRKVPLKTIFKKCCKSIGTEIWKNEISLYLLPKKVLVKETIKEVVSLGDNFSLPAFICRVLFPGDEGDDLSSQDPVLPTRVRLVVTEHKDNETLFHWEAKGTDADFVKITGKSVLKHVQQGVDFGSIKELLLKLSCRKQDMLLPGRLCRYAEIEMHPHQLSRSQNESNDSEAEQTEANADEPEDERNKTDAGLTEALEKLFIE